MERVLHPGWIDLGETTCYSCDGNGYYEVGPQCSSPASSCCGGCYVKEGCEKCDTRGKVETSLYFEHLYYSMSIFALDQESYYYEKNLNAIKEALMVRQGLEEPFDFQVNDWNDDGVTYIMVNEALIDSLDIEKMKEYSNDYYHYDLTNKNVTQDV